MTNFLSKVRRVVSAFANALMAGEYARDRKLHEQWTELHNKAATDAKLRLIQVRDVYQKAANGTKAIVVHRARGAGQDAWFDGVRQDAWFDGRRVQRGAFY